MGCNGTSRSYSAVTVQILVPITKTWTDPLTWKFSTLFISIQLLHWDHGIEMAAQFSSDPVDVDETWQTRIISVYRTHFGAKNQISNDKPTNSFLYFFIHNRIYHNGINESQIRLSISCVCMLISKFDDLDFSCKRFWIYVFNFFYIWCVSTTRLVGRQYKTLELTSQQFRRNDLNLKIFIIPGIKNCPFFQPGDFIY